MRAPTTELRLATASFFCAISRSFFYAECFGFIEALRTQVASTSSEYDRQRKKNYCDGHERRSGDVGDKHEDDRDNGEDSGYIKVHSL